MRRAWRPCLSPPAGLARCAAHAARGGRTQLQARNRDRRAAVHAGPVGPGVHAGQRRLDLGQRCPRRGAPGSRDRQVLLPGIGALQRPQPLPSLLAVGLVAAGAAGSTPRHRGRRPRFRDRGRRRCRGHPPGHRRAVGRDRESRRAPAAGRSHRRPRSRRQLGPRRPRPGHHPAGSAATLRNPQNRGAGVSAAPAGPSDPSSGNRRAGVRGAPGLAAGGLTSRRARPGPRRGGLRGPTGLHARILGPGRARRLGFGHHTLPRLLPGPPLPPTGSPATSRSPARSPCARTGRRLQRRPRRPLPQPLEALLRRRLRQPRRRRVPGPGGCQRMVTEVPGASSTSTDSCRSIMNRRPTSSDCRRSARRAGGARRTGRAGGAVTGPVGTARVSLRRSMTNRRGRWDR